MYGDAMMERVPQLGLSPTENLRILRYLVSISMLITLIPHRNVMTYAVTMEGSLRMGPQS